MGSEMCIRDSISRAAARPDPSNFERMGRGPARSIKFQRMGRCPTQPITFSTCTVGPGPAHHIFKSLGPARPGPDKRPMTSPGNQLEIKYFSTILMQPFTKSGSHGTQYQVYRFYSGVIPGLVENAYRQVSVVLCTSIRMLGMLNVT